MPVRIRTECRFECHVRLKIESNGTLVACGDAEAVALLTIQTEGKKPLTVPEFLRGRALTAGSILS